MWKAQQGGENNPCFLFVKARDAMAHAARRGCSVDRAWPTRGRQRPVRARNISDLEPDEPNHTPILELLGEDERAGQFPAVVALRDLLECIYSYGGYTEDERCLLRGYVRGLSKDELR